MTLLKLSMPVRSTCQMNRRIVGTAVGGCSILCVLIISNHEENSTQKFLCAQVKFRFRDPPQGLTVPSSTTRARAEV